MVSLSVLDTLLAEELSSLASDIRLMSWSADADFGTIIGYHLLPALPAHHKTWCVSGSTEFATSIALFLPLVNILKQVEAFS